MIHVPVVAKKHAKKRKHTVQHLGQSAYKTCLTTCWKKGQGALTVLQRLCAEDSPRHQTRRHLCPPQHPLPLRQPWHRRLSFPDFSLPDLSLPAREPNSDVTTVKQPGRGKSTPMGAAHPPPLRRRSPRTGVRPQGGVGRALRHVTPVAIKAM